VRGIDLNSRIDAETRATLNRAFADSWPEEADTMDTARAIYERRPSSES